MLEAEALGLLEEVERSHIAVQQQRKAVDYLVRPNQKAAAQVVVQKAVVQEVQRVFQVSHPLKKIHTCRILTKVKCQAKTTIPISRS